MGTFADKLKKGIDVVSGAMGEAKEQAAGVYEKASAQIDEIFDDGLPDAPVLHIEGDVEVRHDKGLFVGGVTIGMMNNEQDARLVAVLLEQAREKHG